MSGLNPQVRTIEVGVRELREEKIYPLSMKDQLALPEVLIDAFGKFSSLDYKAIANNTIRGIADAAMDKAPESEKNDLAKNKDIATVKVAIELIERNIDYILEKTTDGVTMEDLTNEQFVDVVDIIFTVNYEGSVGKVLDLAKRVKSLFNRAKTQDPGPKA